MMKYDIIGLGTAFIDDLLTVDEYPPADHKAEVRGEARAFGGCIGTALAAAARLGRACAYAGVFGDDQLSSSMCKGFAQAGVDCSLVIRQDGATPGHSVIISDRTHHTRNIFYSMGGCTPLPPAAVSDGMVARCKVVLVDHFGPDAALAAAATARKLGRCVVSDIELPDYPRLSEMLGLVDNLICSANFASAVTGQKDPAEAARSLHNGRTCTAVTCGTDGSFFVVGGSTVVAHQPAFKVKTLETTGCGDVFHGAYAAALAEGKSVPECMKFAAAAAAIYASRPSGWKYLATKADVDKMCRNQ